MGSGKRSERNLSRKLIALVGDIVASREMSERIAFDERLLSTLGERSDLNPNVVSRYTLIGDDVQAVFSGASSLFSDAVSILSDIHPVRMRFSYGVGTLVKPINPEQAIEMDGPAFYRARDGVNQLKATDYCDLYPTRVRMPCRQGGPASAPTRPGATHLSSLD